MKVIDTKNAVGTVLCHDITQIIPGQFKGAKFLKGHIVSEEDIPILLSMGKKHLYVYEKNDKLVHENDAALVLRDICINNYMYESDIREGKIELKSKVRGCLIVDKKRLKLVNSKEDFMIATIKDGNVDVDTRIAGMRIIPLMIEKEKLNYIKEIVGNNPILSIYPYVIKKFGLIITGSEVYNKLINDRFSPIIENKLLQYGTILVKKIYCDDEKDMIVNAINDLRKDNVELIICAGGMSVDPDDMTSSSIIESGANIVSYGSPLLPGAMLLIGYFENNIPIIGLPACAMYASFTAFDVILPRVLANIRWSKDEIAELGYGGLCQNCRECRFPNCTFGN